MSDRPTLRLLQGEDRTPEYYSEVTDLTGHTVVVLGAGGGLGPVAARGLAGAGARVALVDRDEALLADLVRELGDAVVSAEAVDLLDDEATSAYARSLGPVDAVWHLIGGWRGGTPIEQQPLEDWALLHDLLVRTVVHSVRAFTPALLGSPMGRFMLVTSPQGKKPTSSNAAYGAMKAAAEAIMVALGDRFAGTPASAITFVVPAILTPAMRAKDPDRPRPGFVPAEDLVEAMAYATAHAGDSMNGQHIYLTTSES